MVYWGHSARAVWWDETSATVKTDADCPKGCILAAQIALCIRFDEELADFECVRYFYDGPGDPFSTECRKVPNALVQELGVFVLPANRQWDKLLSFGSSSFLKVLKASGSIPGNTIDQLKAELRTLASKIEDDPAVSDLIARAERELTQFQMFKDGAQLLYRPTLLDTRSVMQSLVPHVQHSGFLLPFSRHGDGVNSLHAFLIVLAFAIEAFAACSSCVMAADEFQNLLGEDGISDFGKWVSERKQDERIVHEELIESRRTSDAGILEAPGIEGKQSSHRCEHTKVLRSHGAASCLENR